MSGPHTEEQRLSEALRDHTTGIDSDRDFYAAVRTWHRRRKQRAVGACTAGVAAGAAITVALANLPARGDTRPATPVVRATPQNYDHPNGVRGSLGGDQEVLAAATAAVHAQITAESSGSQAFLPPSVLKPVYAERLNGTAVVLFEGSRAEDKTYASGVIAWQQRPGGKWTATYNYSKRDFSAAEAKIDVEYAQRTYGDPFWVTTVGDRSQLLAIVVPRDVQAEAANSLTVTADGTVDRPYQPLALHAGTLLVDLRHPPTAIQFSQHGRVVSHWTHGATMGGGGTISVDDSLYPTKAQAAAAAALARGTVNQNALDQAVRSIGRSVQKFAGTPMRFRVFWGSLNNGKPALLYGMQFPSGALYVEQITVDAVRTERIPVPGHPGTYQEAGTSYSEVSVGTVSAGAIDRTLLAVTLTKDHDFLIVGPPGAVRAEVDFGGQPVPVQLENGYARLQHRGTAGMVRVYDASGRLLDQRHIDDGVHDQGF